MQQNKYDYEAVVSIALLNCCLKCSEFKSETMLWGRSFQACIGINAEETRPASSKEIE